MSRAVFRGATCGLLCGWLPVAGAAGFVDDSKLKLQLRNVYFNENFRDEQGMSARAAANAKSERVEWAQGFLLDYQSGFTNGTLGVGLDALGLWGYASTPVVGAVARGCCRCMMMAALRTSSPALG